MQGCPTAASAAASAAAAGTVAAAGSVPDPWESAEDRGQPSRGLTSPADLVEGSWAPGPGYVSPAVRHGYIVNDIANVTLSAILAAVIMYA